MRRPGTEPLLTPKKTGIIWLASAVVLGCLIEVSSCTKTPWRHIIPLACGAGHVCLVFAVARGRLFGSGTISPHRTDFATVVGALWIGPIWWYYEWSGLGAAFPNVPPRAQCLRKKHWFYLALGAAIGALLIGWRLWLLWL